MVLIFRAILQVMNIARGSLRIGSLALQKRGAPRIVIISRTRWHLLSSNESCCRLSTFSILIPLFQMSSSFMPDCLFLLTCHALSDLMGVFVKPVYSVAWLEEKYTQTFKKLKNQRRTILSNCCVPHQVFCKHGTLLYLFELFWISLWRVHVFL